ncbi:MAG: hypothetical protein ACLFMQ_01700 [Desulfohalobiaceae bacterium]
MKTLIAKTTDAVDSGSISIERRTSPYHHVQSPITLCAQGTLESDEEVVLQIPDGSGWQDWYDSGSKVALTSDNNVLTVQGPVQFRVSKPATTNEVGVIMFEFK